MRRHLKNLCFKTFLMVSWGAYFVFFTLPTRVLNIHNSCKNAIIKMGVHLGVTGLHPLHSPSFVRVCFTPKHTLTFMGPWTSLLIRSPMLRLRQVKNILYCITNHPTPSTKNRNTCISI